MFRLVFLNKDTQSWYRFQRFCAKAIKPITLHRFATVQQLKEQLAATEPPGIILLDAGMTLLLRLIGTCKRAYPTSTLRVLVPNVEFDMLKTCADGLLKRNQLAASLLLYITAALNRGGVPLCPKTARVVIDWIRNNPLSIQSS